ncbi:transketolase [Calidifontimicrobium sp. SYSU G02091]|uniref:transketolase n=1 Tax=Calidifontimicrobium sp. SYSU G02091 TaxID=2926421 RepID=UPI001F536C3D|nr:transketolase [Calidifontimicrobium sp. SYSU G02091]MCI1191362.1 transketolase [Calidifontimicrobium sp. SYSU G02091]
MTPSLKTLADAIRMLAVDAVQQANSGHPGAPMGMADIATVLWRQHLKHDPADPAWPDRDRFVLSNGHGSMLLYALLHLTGYDLPIDELKRFRQLHSKTPGHPEVGITPGVETTTGPLGQGITNAVGMALAEALLASTFNRPGHTIVDHRTWVFLGDGCLMEGISHEACSLAGTLGLGKLIAVWDDNGISIDGHVEPWFSDDTPKRFEAYGWRVIRDVDGHDPAAVDAALRTAMDDVGKPTLVCCKTVIGHGSPNKAGTHEVHGAALGAAEVAATRAALGWPYPPFEIPPEIRAAWDQREAGAARHAVWTQRFAAYRAAHPELAAEFERRVMRRALPADYPRRSAEALAKVVAEAATIASRKASQNAITALLPLLPELLGGSADLTGSNLTDGKTSVPVRRGPEGLAGNHVNYGVREFGMSAMMNGIALHGGFIPYGGTFLTFSDYARNAVRMSALMHQGVVYVYTHDSIGLGEDGPTHQPIEHIASLRLIPNNRVWRPCDAVETFVAWQAAVERRDGPTCLILSRQNLPAQMRSDAQLDAIRRGGYVLAGDDTPAQVTLLATGSEVALAMAARERLAQEGIAARVVSMPCCEVFDAQDAAYRAQVLPRDVPVLAIEAGVTNYWRAYTGFDGDVIGIDRFGESAPGPQVYEALGVTTARVVERAKALAAKGAR